MQRVASVGMAAISIAGAFLISLPEAYWALLAAMAADIAMGMLRAYVRKELLSDIAFIGMIKKTAVLIVVGLAAALGHFLSIQIPGANLPLGQAVAIWFCVEEALSVLENAVAVGVPIPRFLRDALMARSPEKFDFDREAPS